MNHREYSRPGGTSPRPVPVAKEGCTRSPRGPGFLYLWGPVTFRPRAPRGRPGPPAPDSGSGVGPPADSTPVFPGDIPTLPTRTQEVGWALGTVVDPP